MKYEISLNSIPRQLFNSLLLGLFFFITQQVFGATTKDFVDSGRGDNLVPSGKGWGISSDLANFPGKGARGNKGGHSGGGSSSNGINYHGGPLITSNARIYYIYYGNNWNNPPESAALPILSAFASNIGGSPYFAINTTYYDSSNTFVANAVTLNSPTAQYPFNGGSLSDQNVQDIVKNTINSGVFGQPDPNGVYFVLTSSDVSESSGFCTKYCGWHTYTNMSYNGKNFPVKYAFVGNPRQCPSACEAQSTGPNADPSNSDSGADGMVNVIAHELEEAVTDPQLNAWYDRRGYENADKCAWKFGATYYLANGSQANMKLGGKDYLIQQNWLNAGGGGCTLSYP